MLKRVVALSLICLVCIGTVFSTVFADEISVADDELYVQEEFIIEEIISDDTETVIDIIDENIPESDNTEDFSMPEDQDWEVENDETDTVFDEDAQDLLYDEIIVEEVIETIPVVIDEFSEEPEEQEIEAEQSVITALGLGDYGDNVYELQIALKSYGYLQANADGVFGVYTQKAVKVFQMYNNLTVTGIADEYMQTLLYTGYCYTFSNMSNGDYSYAVYGLQKMLSELGYLTVTPDGTFGSYTEAAVKKFQSRNGITADGVVGPLSLDKLFGDPLPAARKTQLTEVMQRGSSGNQVYTLQEILTDMGFMTVEADGYFGAYTERAVKLFQMYNSLEVTGIMDEASLMAMNSGGTDFYSLSRDEYSYPVYILQKVLIEYGYLSGTADGHFGTNTYNALKQFQAWNNLYINGVLNFASAEMLFEDPYYYTLDDNNYAIILAKNTLDRIGWNLYSAYSWSVATPYVSYTGDTVYSSAVYCFNNYVGDCLGKAATFYYMAKVLGYSVNVIYGTVPYANGTEGNHCWNEIWYNGGYYVCDPDFESDEGRSGWMIYYGQSGTWRYNYGYVMAN